MVIIEDVRNTTATFPHVVLTIGSFDGVHRGHRRILERVVEMARAASGTAAVMTLRPHPREFFTPSHAPNLLTTHEKKLSLFAAAGIDTAYVLPFDEVTAGLSSEEFVREIIVNRCRAQDVVVGHDFHFGAQASGDFALLDRLSRELGFRAFQEPALIINGERVSSSMIRERILDGDLEEAAELLGRRYSISGVVTRGRGIGVTLGFPTANIKPLHSATPAQGVYVARLWCDGAFHAAAVNIGIAPTIRHEDITIEAHVLDFSENLLGKKVEIEFIERLRPEKEFTTREALQHQISEDVQEVRSYFARFSQCAPPLSE